MRAVLDQRIGQHRIQCLAHGRQVAGGELAPVDAAIGECAVQHRSDRQRRAVHRHRLAMRPDAEGVGECREQLFEVELVKATLDRPAPSRQIPLQVLQELCLEAVGAVRILSPGHDRKCRHLIQQRRVGVVQVERVDLLILDQRLVTPVPIRVHGQHAGSGIEEALQIPQRGLESAWRHRHLAGWRARPMAVPPHRRAIGRVLGQQRMQQRGPGARATDHEDRPLDSLGCDGWNSPPIRRQQRAGGDNLQQLTARCSALAGIQLPELIQPLRQSRQTLGKAALQQVKMTGGIARGLDDLSMIESYGHDLCSAGGLKVAGCMN